MTPLALALLCAALPCAAGAGHGWPVSVSEAGLTNSFGEELGTTVSSNTALNVSSRITNTSGAGQDLLYIVQIKDQAGTVVQLKWFGNSLAAGGSASMAVSWTPPEPGQYRAEIFVWQDLSTQLPLADVSYLDVTVG